VAVAVVDQHPVAQQANRAAVAAVAEEQELYLFSTRPISRQVQFQLLLEQLEVLEVLVVHKAQGQLGLVAVIPRLELF
jgi:hypothetical protein